METPKYEQFLHYSNDTKFILQHLSPFTIMLNLIHQHETEKSSFAVRYGLSFLNLKKCSIASNNSFPFNVLQNAVLSYYTLFCPTRLINCQILLQFSLINTYNFFQKLYGTILNAFQ